MEETTILTAASNNEQGYVTLTMIKELLGYAFKKSNIKINAYLLCTLNIFKKKCLDGRIIEPGNL